MYELRFNTVYVILQFDHVKAHCMSDEIEVVYV